MQRVFGDSEPAYPVSAVVVLEVERAEALLSPAYWRVSDENELRAIWRGRREGMDREFDVHVAASGPVRVEHDPVR